MFYLFIYLFIKYWSVTPTQLQRQLWVGALKKKYNIISRNRPHTQKKEKESILFRLLGKKLAQLSSYINLLKNYGALTLLVSLCGNLNSVSSQEASMSYNVVMWSYDALILLSLYEKSANESSKLLRSPFKIWGGSYSGMIFCPLIKYYWN